MKPIAFAVLLAISLVTFAGCKPKATQESETQSLNNFARSAGGALVPNDCTGGPEAEQNVVLGIEQEWDHVDFSEINSSLHPTMKADLKRAMSAVPLNLQDLYFGLGGTIKFTADPAGACNVSGAKEQFAKEGQSTAYACWGISPANNFIIYMQPKTEAIRHSTVRMFGYVLSQILTSVSLNDQNKIVYERDESFLDSLSLVNTAFMGDVRNSIAAAKKSGQKAKYNMEANKDLVKDPEFKFYVFAESFDSFYCNKSLRDDMARADEFPLTFAEFVKLDTALRQVKTSAPAGALLTDTPIEIDETYDASAGGGMALRRLGLFGGMARLGAGLGRGVLRGGAMVGRGVVRGGAAVLRGGGRLLGGAVRGTGVLLGGAARVVGRGAVGVGRFLFGRRP